ncbi:WRKY family transcription factor [Actinidia rufa]|uniref:WRKY family transcription factor n=1 Tax=Actinidia rufa TaxID=165716 RepID=A0A7J0F212_9ERIC|nr:WRKY family transcription factor [Actinidia rufa]
MLMFEDHHNQVMTFLAAPSQPLNGSSSATNVHRSSHDTATAMGFGDKGINSRPAWNNDQVEELKLREVQDESEEKVKRAKVLFPNKK